MPPWGSVAGTAPTGRTYLGARLQPVSRVTAASSVARAARLTSGRLTSRRGLGGARLAAGEQVHHYDEEQGHEEDGEEGRGQRAAHNRATDRVLAAGAGTRRDGQRENAED